MKKTFLKFFAAVLMVGFAAVSVGCKDYDDDIESLNSAVAGLQQTVSSLQSQINNGKTISSVTNTADGVTVTLSDGSSFTITNGKDGKDGSDGAGAASSVWTIGDDGFWYENGKATEYKAIGTDGVYYVPVTEGEHKGEWQVYQNGEPVEPAQYEGSWLGEGITAVMDGGVLTFYGVKDAEGNVIEDGITITQGGSLGSLVFDPAVLDEKTLYPTTEQEFYVMPSVAVLDSAKPWTNKAKTFVSLSNVVDMPYFINPADAYISDNASMYNFVVKEVSIRTRADEEVAPLVAKAVDLESVEGQVIVKAQVNSDFLAEADEDDFEGDAVLVAVQAWAGTSVVTSDFISLTAPQEIEAVALGKYDAAAYKKNYATGVTANPWEVAFSATNTTAWHLVELAAPASGVTFNSNAYLNAQLENDEHASFLKSNVVYTAELFEMGYDEGKGSLDLKKLVKLYGQSEDNWYELESLGFDPADITYTFELPKEFMPTNNDTNQQDFVELKDGVVSINSKYAVSAVGRTPIVYVTASIDGQLVAAGYVVVKIVAGSTAPADEFVVAFPKAADKIYNQLTDLEEVFPATDVTMSTTDKDGSKGAYNVVAEFDWSNFNQMIYDALGVYPADFWKEYYKEVDVKVTVDATEAEAKTVLDEGGILYDRGYVVGKANYKDVWKNNVLTLAEFSYEVGADALTEDVGQKNENEKADYQYNAGIQLYLEGLNQDETTTETSKLRIAVNELVLTQHTFGMYEDKGAKYTVTITFNPIKAASPVVIKQEFYVSHDHENAPEFGDFFYNAADKAKLNARGITDEKGAALDANKPWAYITGDMQIAEDGMTWEIAQKFANIFKDANIEDLGGNIDYAEFWFTARDIKGGMYYYNEKGGNGTNGLNTDSEYLSVTDAEKDFTPAKSTDLKDTKIGLVVEDAGEDESGVTPEIENGLMYLDHIVRTLNYVATLKNGEQCDPNFFYIVFRNEFAVENTRTVEFDNASGPQAEPLFGEGFAVVEDMLNATNLPILEWVKTTDKDGKTTFEGFKVAKGADIRELKYDGSNTLSATNSFEFEYEVAEDAKIPEGASLTFGTDDQGNPTVIWTGGTAQIGNGLTVNVKVTVKIGGAFMIETTIPVKINHRA